MAARGLAALIPACGWLKDYKRADLTKDVSAGLIVAVMLVPQGMAYALLAGLPPVYGLYASTVPAVVYALFGTSRHMPVGPPALMALLTFAGVAELARPGTQEFASYALLLALMAGGLQLALGLANVSSAFSSGFPVAGSFSRTAVQYGSGARTQLASVVTAFAVVLTLLFLTPLFYFLPDAALAAIVVVAVYGLLDFGEIRRTFEVRKADGYAMVLTFAATLLVGVEEGIIAGSVFALLAFVRRTAYPEMTELGYVLERDAFLGLRSHPEARTFPEALVVRLDARLYYANVPFFERWLAKAAANKPRLRWIVIDCRGVNGVDVTAVEGLEDLISSYKAKGVTLLLTHAKLQVRERLESAHWDEKFGPDVLHPTTRGALASVGLLQKEPAEAAPTDTDPRERLP